MISKKNKVLIGIGVLSLILLGGIMIMLIFNKPENPKGTNEPDVSQEEPPKIEQEVFHIPEKLSPYFETLDNEVRLTSQEIKDYNGTIKAKTDALYDVTNITKVSVQDIKNYITSYSMPTLPKYDGSKSITKTQVDEILDNRNLDQINEDNFQRGLVVARSNLRSFPSMTHFYNSNQNTQVDNLQESELLVNTPVLILHESLDANWYFVMAPNYVGWVLKETVAIVTTDDWNYFLNEENFVVITDPIVKVGDTTLDMSVRLPLEKTTEDSYKVVLPKRATNGNLAKETISLAKDQAYIGYLPYTLRNLYMEALLYENTPYTWGGYTGGVDCSGYISNIFGTFGFKFPRNTSSQNTSVGQIIDLSNQDDSTKLQTIEKHPGSLLYQAGHVTLYLGTWEDKHYIIHANGTTWNVAITVLENSSYLPKIDKNILLEKEK